MTLRLLTDVFFLKGVRGFCFGLRLSLRLFLHLGLRLVGRLLGGRLLVLAGTAALALGGLLGSCLGLGFLGRLGLHYRLGLHGLGLGRGQLGLLGWLGVGATGLDGSCGTQETAVGRQNVGHRGHRRHLEVADIEGRHLELVLRLGVGLGLGGLVALVLVASVVLAVHLGVIHGRLGEELGLEVLTTLALAFAVGRLSLRRRALGVGGLAVEYAVNKVLWVEGHSAQLRYAELFRYSDKVNLGFRLQFCLTVHYRI